MLRALGRVALTISLLNIGFLLFSTFTLSPTPNALAEQMQEMGLTLPPHIITCLSGCLQGLSLRHKLDLPRPLPPSPPLTHSPSLILILMTTSRPFRDSSPVRSWRQSRSGFQTQKIVRNIIKILLFSPNFLLTFITDGLLSYSVRLYYYEDKTSRFILQGDLGQLFYKSWLSSYSGPGSAPSSNS